MDKREAYETALAQYKWAYTDMVDARSKYRRRMIGDAEFLAVKAAFDKAKDAVGLPALTANQPRKRTHDIPHLCWPYA